MLPPCCICHMSEVIPLRFQVVFWDSEAPGFEGDRIQFSQKRLLPVDTTKTLSAAWRSDRRCRFPVEIGLRLQAPCRLREISIVSEPALAPSAVECFVAGPTRSKREAGDKQGLVAVPRGLNHRHNGSITASTDAARAGYLSSVFVRAGRAEFSRTKQSEIVEQACATDSSRAEGSRRSSKMAPTAGTTTAVGAAAAPSIAVLSGLTFKGQFLRLTLWEAAGSGDNPGRQVSVTGIQVLGRLLTEEHPPGQPKLAAQNHLKGGTPDRAGKDGDRDKELEKVLLDLGIEPLLAQGSLGIGKEERGRRGVSKGSSRGGSVDRGSGGKGWEGGGRGAVEPEDAVAAEASRKVKQMLQIARTQDRFHEAEMLSLQLDRVRSLASSLRSARKAQERAARRENFDQAKRSRDEAREAEVWLLQSVRDASDIVDAGGGGRPSRHHADHTLAADTSPVARTDVVSAGGTAPPTSGSGDLQEPAPSHDPGSNQTPAREKTVEGVPSDLAGGVARRGSVCGDGGSDRGAPDEERPPWLNPSCPRSTEPWRALLKLPWPAGERPDFRTVFSHKWATSSAVGELGGDGGGGSTSRIPLQPGGLLRTILRLVAASQDLRPPGPVPPDTAPFRHAGSACGRPPLCTFFLPPRRLATASGGGKHGGGVETVGAREKSTAPGMNKSSSGSSGGRTGRTEEVASKLSAKKDGGRESGVVLVSGGDSGKPSNGAGNAEEAEDAVHLLREGGDNLGKAFGHPAADCSPAATHVVNFVEDHAGLAWCSFGLRGPNRRRVGWRSSVQRLDPSSSSHDAHPAANEPEEAGGRIAKGKRRRSAADEDESDGDDETDEAGAPVRLKRRGGEGRVGGPKAVGESRAATAAAAAAAAAASERLLEEAATPSESAAAAAAVLPDIVGAGGFAEFMPLLDTVFGRVPMSAACSGFPARMREESIRLCQAHLDLTADTAVEAYTTVSPSSLSSTAATAKTSIGTQATSSSSTLSSLLASRAAPQLDSEKPGSKRDSRTDILGKLNAEKSEESPQKSDCCNNSSSDSERRSSSSRRRSSSGSSSSGNAVGAVVRAACLVAAQGLMDPTQEVRLAGADLARSALSLWSPVPTAAVDGDAREKKEAETGVVGATPARQSNETAKKGSISDEDAAGIAGDGRSIGETPTASSRGSVGSDDSSTRGGTVRKNGAARDDDDTESLSAETAQSGSAKTDLKLDGRGSSVRSAVVSDSAANVAMPKLRPVVPLRDLRWGLELVLACVAPYLSARRAVVSDQNNNDGGVMPTAGGVTAGSVGNNSGRCSTSASTDSRRRQNGPSPDQTIAEGGSPGGEGGSSGGGGDCDHDDDTEQREDLAPPPADFSLTPEEGGDGEVGCDDGGRSLLALRVVDFACRHPDIGPALVSSVLVGWVPRLVRWGCNTPVSARAAPIDDARGGRPGGMPRSPRRAAFTAGEAAASEALASGAIEMMVYMVENFTLLPLSDFSPERLIAAAEDGMSFAGRARSSGAGNGDGRPPDGIEGRRDGEAAGGRGTAATAVCRGEGRGRGGAAGFRRSQRSSTNGRAKEAGEALMLELFLRTSGGGGRGGLDLGLDGCLDSLLPALNTARGINFLDRAAATADLHASETRRADKKTGRSKKTGVEEGRLQEGGNSSGSHPGNRASSCTARRKCVKGEIRWTSQRRRFASKVQVRQRLELPPAPPAMTPVADRGLSDSAVSNGSSAAALTNGGNKTTSTTLHKDDNDNVCHLTRHDTTPGVYPHMSDSSSAEALSASTVQRSTATGVLSQRGGGAGAPRSVLGHDDSSSGFSEFSHGSLSEDPSESEGGSNIGPTTTRREPREDEGGMGKEEEAAPAQDKSATQAATADSNRKSKKVFPILGFGSKIGDNDVEEDPAGTGKGEETGVKKGGGLMSRMFGRGKK